MAIIIFLAAAPPLVLYTAGWRYDFTYNRLVATGSLVVKSQPSRATITLESQPYGEATPTIINDIVPGKINLAITKPNYFPWERTLVIKPRVTMLLENIRLFPQAAPAILIAKPLKQYWWNQKQDKMAYLTVSGQLRLFNTLNNKDSLLADVSAKPLQNLSWAPLGDELLVSRGRVEASEQYIIDANFPEKFITLAQVVNEPLTMVQWDLVVPNTLYGVYAGSLYRVPYLLRTARLVVPGPVINYTIDNNHIIWLEKNAVTKTLFLSWVRPSDPNTIHRLTLPIEAQTATFLPTNSARIALYNAPKKLLIIADPAAPASPTASEVIEIPDVQKAVWSHDGSRLLYNQSGAIYERTFTNDIAVIPASPTTELITRYSDAITNIFWSDNEAYLFYSIGRELNVLEMNPNFPPYSLTLFTADSAFTQAEFIAGRGLITFIDSQGILQGLPTLLEERGTGFFGN